MKVNVTLTLDIDPEAWQLNYGSMTVRELREDVKTYVQGLVQDSAPASISGGITSVELKS